MMTKSFDNREGWIWMNGGFIEWKKAKSHIISQGLHYASAVFEGERAYNGIIFKSAEHTKRLFKSAEIIGSSPNELDYSLYDFLIMNDAWRLGRKNIGYHTVNQQKLMVRFGNKPYVDVKSSFNSLIPKSINKKLRQKLIKYYLKKLSKYP